MSLELKSATISSSTRKNNICASDIISKNMSIQYRRRFIFIPQSKKYNSASASTETKPIILTAGDLEEYIEKIKAIGKI